MKLKLLLEDDQYPYKGVTHVRHVVRAFVMNEEGKICLNHLYGDDGFGHRDYYETPGGGVEGNEDLLTALHREIKEEVGFDIENIKELGIVVDFYNLIYRQNINHFYFATISSKSEKHLTSFEQRMFDKQVWVTLDEAKNLYETMQDELVGHLVKQRELPILLELIETLNKEGCK